MIGDYGIAVKSLDRQDSMVYTYPMAPEVLRRSGYDDKVDMWGMGIVAYQLLNPTI